MWVQWNTTVKYSLENRAVEMVYRSEMPKCFNHLLYYQRNKRHISINIWSQQYQLNHFTTPLTANPLPLSPAIGIDIPPTSQTVNVGVTVTMSCTVLSPSINLVTQILWYMKGDTDVQLTEGVTTFLGEITEIMLNMFASSVSYGVFFIT